MAEGEVRLHGEIEGELQCLSLCISKNGRIAGKIAADNVLVNGTVEGPIHGSHVILGPTARVTGDVHHVSIIVKEGAQFEGNCKRREESAKQLVAPIEAKDYVAFKRRIGLVASDNNESERKKAKKVPSLEKKR